MCSRHTQNHENGPHRIRTSNFTIIIHTFRIGTCGTGDIEGSIGRTVKHEPMVHAASRVASHDQTCGADPKSEGLTRAWKIDAAESRTVVQPAVIHSCSSIGVKADNLARGIDILGQVSRATKGTSIELKV